MHKVFFVAIGLLFCVKTQAQNELIPQTGHSGAFSMALSHDDKKLLTAGTDGRIMLWDIAAAKAIRNFRPVNSAIYCIGWKHDGSGFAIATADSLIVLFDGNTGAETKRFKSPFVVTEICFHPKKNVLAIGGTDGRIKVLDHENGSVYFSFEPDNYITGLAFSNNGALLFAAGWNKGVVAYDMNQGKVMMSIPLQEGHNASGMELSSNNEFLFLHMREGITEVVNLYDGKSTGSIPNTRYYQDANDIYYLEPALTSDNQFVLSTNHENNFVISNLKTNVSLIYNNSFSQSKVTTIIPSHEGQFFIFTDLNGSISCVYFNETLFKNESPLLWRKLQAIPERIYRIDFLNNDRTLAMVGNGYYQFNMATGDMHRRDGDSAVISDREYTSRYFITDNSGTYYYADLMRNSGYEFGGDMQWALRGLAFSEDTLTVAFIDHENKLVVFDLENRVKRLEKKITDDYVLFNGSVGDHFVYSNGKELRFINKLGEMAKTISLGGDKRVIQLCADASLKRIYLLDAEQLVSCYDFSTGENIPLPGELAQLGQVRMIDLSRDGKTLAIQDGKSVVLYHAGYGKSFHTIDTGTEQLYALGFNKKGNHVCLALENGIVQLWDVEKKQKLFSALASPQDGMVVFTDDHYYMATREAARQLVFTQNNSSVSLANVELTYNRPDKVLEKTGLCDQRLINAYRFAHERRMKRSKNHGGTETGDVPTVTLANQSSLKASTNLDQVTLKMKASNAGKKISALKMWVNNVPVYGQQGLAVEARNEVEKDITLDLVSGTNHIKFSAVNENGTESEKQEITVVNTHTVKPDLYILTIGTSKYKNAAFNLSYAAKDAHDMAGLFARLEGNENRPYNRIVTKTLVNDQVTFDAIKKTRAFLEQAKPNDVLVVFVAGHGVRDEQMHYFFGTHDMNFEKPADKGFSEEDFAQLVDGLRVVRKLVFFDTCLSGELDKDEAILASNQTTKSGDVSFRAAGAGVRAKTSGFENASALMREIYNNLDEGTGATIISSAGGAEYAMESGEWQNGLFTYCFMKGLRNYAADSNNDKEITVSEIQDYVRREVVKLSKGKQQPSFKNENLVMNYRIW